MSIVQGDPGGWVFGVVTGLLPRQGVLLPGMHAMCCCLFCMPGLRHEACAICCAHGCVLAGQSLQQPKGPVQGGCACGCGVWVPGTWVRWCEPVLMCVVCADWQLAASGWLRTAAVQLVAAVHQQYRCNPLWQRPPAGRPARPGRGPLCGQHRQCCHRRWLPARPATWYGLRVC
jgi:hypothetical protein